MNTAREVAKAVYAKLRELRALDVHDSDEVLPAMSGIIATAIEQARADERKRCAQLCIDYGNTPGLGQWAQGAAYLLAGVIKNPDT